MRRILPFLLFSLLGLQVLFAQGVTTSSMKGQISDEQGEPLFGVNITAVHGPTGTYYGTTTDLDGYYRISNMTVGGPYKITYSFVGLEETTLDNVYLRLGEAFDRDVTLGSSAITLDEFTVTAKAGSVGKNTGASTQISTEDIDLMPTLNRNLTDFTKLTPQASGSSFAGTNNRFNAIFVDGAVNNDVFGLAGSGTNGGQTGIAPFSIDIIDQLQVVLSPYDVSLGGFAGGGINAVTKSGTNRFEGTAYYFLQNQSLVGKTNSQITDRTGNERTGVADFTNETYGASLGGPLVKDKIFFFTNVELQQDVNPNPFDVGLYTGSDGRASASDLEGLSTFLQNTYNYDPGTFGDTQDELSGVKIFGKLNFNLSNEHKLTLRHQYTKAENFGRNAGSSNRINFSNNGVYFPSITNSSAIELNSQIGTKMSNNLIIGYTSVNDDRGSLGTDFPYVIIEDGSRGTIQFGTEAFSTGNLLDQKILSITDNLKIYKGKHTFTLGTHNEFYSIRNVFIRQNFGQYRFGSLDDFLNNAPAIEYDRSYSLAPGDERVIGDESQAAADFSAAQIGVYIQDEIEVNNRFKLTAGLRLDVPFITSDPNIHPSFATSTLPLIQAQHDIADDVVPGQAPQGQLMFSPRVGFEYAGDDARKTVIRGGVGVFTSRVPFVWPGAMFNNNGTTVGSVNERDINGDITFRPDPTNQYTNSNFSVPSGQVDLFTNDFKYPQVLRANLAVDKNFEGGWNVSLEGIYTKTLNNVIYTNVNNDTEVGFNWTGTPDDRPVFTRTRIDPTYTDIYVGHNTNAGYTYNITATVNKSFGQNFNANFAYTYGDATSINDGQSSQNSSQWRGQINTDGRNTPLYGRSDFSMGSRVIAGANYRIDWNESGTTGTTISLFYDGQSGGAFSYVYARSGADSRNINNEVGSTGRNRSLIFVPATQSEINLVDYTLSNGTTVTAAQQWANLDALIESDPSLANRRGQYSEKNSGRTPFMSRIDLAIRQDIGTDIGGRGHRLQLSFDVFNLANMINSSWGANYFVMGDFNNNEVINFEGYAADGTTPTFTYRDDQLGKDRLDIANFSSRWSGRVGLRYIFD